MSSHVTDERPSAASKTPQHHQSWLFKQWRILLVSSASVLVVAAAIFWSFRSTPPMPPSAALNQESRSAARVRVTGTTEALRQQAIVAPMLEGQQFGTLTVTKLTSGGTRVHKGDLLVAFDRQAQMRTFIDKQDEYQKLAN